MRGLGLVQFDGQVWSNARAAGFNFVAGLHSSWGIRDFYVPDTRVLGTLYAGSRPSLLLQERHPEMVGGTLFPIPFAAGRFVGLSQYQFYSKSPPDGLGGCSCVSGGCVLPPPYPFARRPSLGLAMHIVPALQLTSSGLLLALVSTSPMVRLQPAEVLSTDTKPDWMTQVAEAIALDEYQYILEGQTARAPNRRQGLRSAISTDGLLLEPREGGAWALRLRTASYGPKGEPGSLTPG